MSSPEVSLWMMVLNQAALDLFEIRSGCSRGTRQVLTRAARGWFNSEKSDPGSFVWVCAVLDLDASTLRRKVFALDRAAVRAASYHEAWQYHQDDESPVTTSSQHTVDNLENQPQS
jgi:hypothetical protein